MYFQSTLGLTSTSVSQTNGVITCSFTRAYTSTDSRFFDLNNDYILMLVIGETEAEDGKGPTFILQGIGTVPAV